MRERVMLEQRTIAGGFVNYLLTRKFVIGLSSVLLTGGVTWYVLFRDADDANANAAAAAVRLPLEVLKQSRREQLD